MDELLKMLLDDDCLDDVVVCFDVFFTLLVKAGSFAFAFAFALMRLFKEERTVMVTPVGNEMKFMRVDGERERKKWYA